jgi:hypothetical protein
MAIYYAVIAVKVLIWTENHGGFAAHNMGVLAGVTLRTSTIHAAILLMAMFVVERRRRKS